MRTFHLAEFRANAGALATRILVTGAFVLFLAAIAVAVGREDVGDGLALAAFLLFTAGVVTYVPPSGPGVG